MDEMTLQGPVAWGGSASAVILVSFLAIAYTPVPGGWAASAAENVLRLLYFPYVLGIPILGFVTLVIAARKSRRLKYIPGRVAVQSLLALAAIIALITTLSLGVPELP
jgi:hypothetical protein